MTQTEALRQGFRQQKRVILLVGAGLLMASLTIGWFGDRRSCERQVPVRKALILNSAADREAIPFWERRGEMVIAERLRERVQADARIRQLDCNQLLPGT